MASRSDPNNRLPSEPYDQVHLQLERLLNSVQFRNSRRCQALLREVTERTLSGDTAGLKERTLGVTVFGRPPDYDSNQDPIIRSTAAEVRKKIAQYYQEPQHQSELRIELIAGSYVPEFRTVTVEPAVAQPARRRPGKGLGYLALLMAGACGLASVVWYPNWKKPATDRFWMPTLKAPGDVLICVGQPVAYNLRSSEAQDRVQSMTDHSVTPAPWPGQETIALNQMVVLWDRYVALGDAFCLVRLTGFLEKHGKRYRIRGEGSTSFPDLRETAAVLIGAFDNQWTLRVASKSRFTFSKDSAHQTDMVHDRDHPERTDWKLTGAWPYWDIQNDYAIVSRVLDVNTDRPLVIAAGITQYGTMAAGEFLTDPDYFSEVLPKLPKNWEKRNMQIVLRVPVVDRASGRPRVLDTYVW